MMNKQFVVEPIIEMIRRKFPQFTWAYNRKSGHWECEAGYVAWVWMGNGDSDEGWSKLCFYGAVGAPIWL